MRCALLRSKESLGFLRLKYLPINLMQCIVLGHAFSNPYETLGSVLCFVFTQQTEQVVNGLGNMFLIN